MTGGALWNSSALRKSYSAQTVFREPLALCLNSRETTGNRLVVTMADISGLIVLGLLSATVIAEKDENTRNIPDHLPYRRSKGSETCDVSEYLLEGRCCQQCAAGTHVFTPCTENHGLSICDPCTDGEDFTEFPNGLGRCLSCTFCRTKDQIQVAPCTRVADTRCQCKEGTYCVPNDDCDLFCSTCSRCSEGEHEKLPCTPTTDTICEDIPVTNSTTRPVHSKDTDQDSATSSVVALSVLVGIFIIVIGILIFFICRYKRKKVKRKQEDAERQLMDNAGSALRLSDTDANVLSQAESDPETYSAATEETRPLNNIELEEGVSLVSSAEPAEESSCPDSRQGRDAHCAELPAEMDDRDWSRLYLCLKETIPASRWKELVRLLGLAETEIDVLSLDHKNDVSELNYQMLLAWRKQEGRRATADAICHVLDAMKLGGCAHRIRDALKDKGIVLGTETLGRNVGFL